MYSEADVPAEKNNRYEEQDYKRLDAQTFTHGNKPISVLANVARPPTEGC